MVACAGPPRLTYAAQLAGALRGPVRVGGTLCACHGLLDRRAAIADRAARDRADGRVRRESGPRGAGGRVAAVRRPAHGQRPPGRHQAQLVDNPVIPSHTTNMKTAISLPDDTFDRASQRATELGMSRSEFFARAAQHYLDELDASRRPARSTSPFRRWSTRTIRRRTPLTPGAGLSTSPTTSGDRRGGVLGRLGPAVGSRPASADPCSSSRPTPTTPAGSPPSRGRHHFEHRAGSDAGEHLPAGWRDRSPARLGRQRHGSDHPEKTDLTERTGALPLSVLQDVDRGLRRVLGL